MTNPAIIEEIEALEVHYFRAVRTPQERKRWLQDYLEDLADLDLERLKSACRQWRQTGAKKFPTSGELRRMAPGRAQQTERLEAWRPLTDEEYDRLSLSDKIRHQRILAEDAAQRAGPQMRNKRPALPEDMPDRWHMWRARAEHHQAEVKRLLKIIHDAKEIRA